ncbi:hypothetical protein EYB45_04420 [Erythrobacteraceae bacterium CFH 75059]|uniref:energy transducer TonB n=1 Tax=Qipengyuania thermophila TaxID=2509361 RepID=UPI001021E70B|nr:hypothetical protein [Qipengyuania thermophila]TCD04800.1 hypothetical protein EYB45_04420 [Erythrobacteraceae bacterium CFH 75059]
MTRSVPSSSVRPGPLVLVIALHAAALLGLGYAFAPAAFAPAERMALEAISVFTPMPPPEPVVEPPPAPDRRPAGAAGAAGARGEARPREAPPSAIQLAPPQALPRAASTGADPDGGAADAGAGTGAGGSGTGTGGGGSGRGDGGGFTPTRPVKIAGDINSAADFPTPPGGRQVRRGTFVEVFMTVGVDGRARNCRVVTPSPDPEADRITCRLAEERFRFEPARDASGNAVAAQYGWRQRWF